MPSGESLDVQARASHLCCGNRTSALGGCEDYMRCQGLRGWGSVSPGWPSPVESLPGVPCGQTQPCCLLLRQSPPWAFFGSWILDTMRACHATLLAAPPLWCALSCPQALTQAAVTPLSFFFRSSWIHWVPQGHREPGPGTQQALGTRLSNVPRGWGLSWAFT